MSNENNNQQVESMAEDEMLSTILPAEVMNSIDNFIQTKDDVSQWIPWENVEARLYKDFPWLK